KIAAQRDRDGLVLKELPPIWDGLTAKGVMPTVTEGQTQHLANRPFAIDDPNGFNLSLDVATRDLLNLFYQNQMQINRGKNDKFVAYGNSGALVMGHYKMPKSFRCGKSHVNTRSPTISLWARSVGLS